MPFHNKHLAALKELICDPDHKVECVELLERAFKGDANLVRLQPVLDAIHTGSTVGIPQSGWSEIDQIFLSSLVRLIDPRAAPRHLHNDIREASLQADALVEHSKIESWTMLQAINYALLLQIRPPHRAAALVTMRDDGMSILEWIAHYRALEFDNIFVYSNDNIDGSDSILFALADAGFITVIWNRTSGAVSPQQKAYDHSLHLLHELRDYKWVFYLDSDELVELSPLYSNSVQRLIVDVEKKFPDRLPSAVGFNWQWYGSGNIFERTAGLLLERFQHAASNNHVKCLVRVSDVTSMWALHYPDLAAGGFIANSKLEKVDIKAIQDDHAPTYEGGRIRHYWFKSFEEFSVKKARGDSLAPGPATQSYKRDFKFFFEWNVKENDANRFAPPKVLVDEVKSEMAFLMTVPGVAAAVERVRKSFPNLIDRYGAAGGLRSIYDECLRKHSDIGRRAAKKPRATGR